MSIRAKPYLQYLISLYELIGNALIENAIQLFIY